MPSLSADDLTWLRDTKATNPLTGQPAILFHGTANVFDRFDSRLVGTKHIDHEAGAAFFFSSCLTQARWYAASSATADGLTHGPGVVLVAVLRLHNPLVVDFQGTGIETLGEDLERAKKEGRDGLIARNFNDGSVADHYIAFDPDSIRIIGDAPLFSSDRPQYRARKLS